MRPLADWLADAIALSEAAFCARHAGPFLVWWSEHGPDPAKYGAVFTMDRIVVGKPTANPAQVLENYYASAVRLRDRNAVDVTIGCAADCDVHVNDASISRVHAHLVTCEGGWRLRDTTSFTGTFVNDAPPTEAPLVSEDRITVGLVDLTYLDSRALYQLIRRLEDFTDK